MKAENLYHSGIIVDDFDETLEWFTKVAGYEWTDVVSVDQVAVTPDGEITIQDHTLVKQIVDDVEQRCVFRAENLVRLAPATRRFGSVRTLRQVRAHWMKL